MLRQKGLIAGDAARALLLHPLTIASKLPFGATIYDILPKPRLDPALETQENRAKRRIRANRAAVFARDAAAFRGYLRSIAITATVSREIHTSLPASSSIRIDQTWVVRPIFSARAVA